MSPKVGPPIICYAEYLLRLRAAVCKRPVV